MKIALLHLSDIHFENNKDWIYNKADLIARASVSSVFSEQIEAFVIIVTGDIANKGLKEQYGLANNFFNQIKEHLKREINIPTYLVVIPGNHDCNFSNENEIKLRTVAIQAVLDNPDICSKGDGIYKKCLEVQQEFFEFATNSDEKLDYPKQPEIFYRLNIYINNQKLVLNCFNTAWLTQKKETPTKLIMPPKLLADVETSSSEPNSLSISIYHHPENWLSPDNKNQFLQLLRNISDVILTGHEHERDIIIQQQIETGEKIQIHRAAALQDRDSPQKSSFNVLLMDFEKNKQKLISYVWERDYYINNQDTGWIDFVRNHQLLHGNFDLKQSFETGLRNLDTLPITHSRRTNLQIDDLFILPRLQVFSLEDVIDGKSEKEPIKASNFTKFISEKQKVLIYGETLQGKTTLAKYLYIKFHAQGIIPLLVRGDFFTKVKESEIKSVLKGAFSEQYRSSSWETFKQRDKSKRMLIIDNFGQSGLNQTQLQNLLEKLSSDFDYVVAIAHSNLRIQQYIENEEGEIKFSSFTHCELRPMNRTQRSALINKWITLGNASISEEALVTEVNQKQQAIETAIDTGIIPPYPAFILGVLQVTDNFAIKAVDKTKYGTVGYLYDSLITNRFQALEDEGIDLAQIYLLLGQMAYNCYKNDRLDISIEETEAILNEYQSVYQQNIYAPKFFEQIASSNIVSRKDSRLRFTSLQLRDFFVAEYFSQALGDEDDKKVASTHNEIDYIIKTLTYESHTRILLFLVYKAYDKPRFINQVLDISKIIFSKFQPTDLRNDIDFLNQLREDLPKPKLLEESSLLERREKLNKEIDKEFDESRLSLYSNKEKFLVEYQENLDDFVKIAITLKMIEVLGQLVRSFASTLKANIKKEITQESIQLGLRLLQATYGYREIGTEEIRVILGLLIQERHPELSEQEIIKRADYLLLYFFLNATYGVVKKISISIGHEDLKAIYANVFTENQSSLSYQMIEAALRLDHYTDPIIDKITKLGDEIKTTNKFAWDVLQRLVADYLNYNSGAKGANRHKLMSKFELENNPNYLLNEEKDERKYLPPPRKSFTPPKNKKRNYSPTKK